MVARESRKDLVDSPNENLSVEYKSWLDLVSDMEARADLARHIAAIANHGGGMIVFGFNDDLSIASASPFPNSTITRDLVSGIIKKYLEPTFQCDVEFVESEAKNTHPIIIIPAHGNTPICAKAGGPQIDGKPQGIRVGTYYTRKPGPESAPITAATEWAPIIRRCALHERAGILSAIGAAIEGTQAAESNVDRDAELKRWHDAAYAQFISDVQATADAPQTLASRNVQLSYSILRGDGQRLDLVELKDTLLLQINNEVQDRVRTGWSMMYPFTKPDIAPRFMIDEASGEGQNDFIECALLRGDTRLEYSNDLWRVASSGKVTLIRSYWEDFPEWGSRFGITPGTTFNPKEHVLAVAEIVRHAQAFAEKFDIPVSVTFLCEWRGLKGRTIKAPRDYYSIGGSATADTRRTTKEVATAALATSWPDIVTDLVAPTVRIFNSSFQVTVGFVSGQAPTWLR